MRFKPKAKLDNSQVTDLRTKPPLTTYDVQMRELDRRQKLRRANKRPISERRRSGR